MVARQFIAGETGNTARLSREGQLILGLWPRTRLNRPPGIRVQSSLWDGAQATTNTPALKGRATIRRPFGTTRLRAKLTPKRCAATRSGESPGAGGPKNMGMQAHVILFDSG
jgi:hypothetical protein